MNEVLKAIEEVWLAPINENAVELTKNSKREAVWARLLSGYDGYSCWVI